MTEETLTAIGHVVLGAQLVVPLALGIPAWRAKTVNWRSAKKSDDETAAPAAAPKIEPLHCPACGASVPLLDTAFDCPFCKAAIRPPEEYVRTFELRRKTIDELHRAERLWRASRITTAWPVVWLFRLLVLGWSGLVVVAAFGMADIWPRPALWLAGLLACVQILVGLALASGFRESRKDLPPLPDARFFHAPADNGTCPDCGAPVRFADDRMAATCGYCGADAYRAGIAFAARADAQAHKQQTRTSLREAVHDVRARRSELVGYFGFMAVAELFYGALLLVAAIYNFLF